MSDDRVRRDYKFAIGYEDEPGKRAYRMSGEVPWSEDPREYVLRMQASYGVKDDPTAFAELTTVTTTTSTENLLEVRRCSHDLGKRPEWMSPDQYDPCTCTRDEGHDGPHACEHEPLPEATT